SGLNVLLCPASVQGESAPSEIEAALSDLNESGLVDLIVLARGGGSLEDLAAFNSERVARAIAASRAPVVSAIGHETDFTIADFAADLRAPTPSAAAELVTEAQHKIAEHLATQEHRLERAARFHLLQARQRLAQSAAADRAESRVTALLYRLGQRLDDAAQRIDAAVLAGLRLRQNRAAELAAAVLRHDPRQRLAEARVHLADLRARLERCVERLIAASASELGALDARLRSLSPLAVLDRGYALVLAANGALIRSTAQIGAGDRLTTRLSDGSFESRVESAAPNLHSSSGATNAPQSRKQRGKKTAS
ncbi:MAG: exodeoxyribonuclease VII large subunit, partial [Terracidiphilus sp.]